MELPDRTLDDAAVAAHAARIAADGFTLLPDVVPPEFCDALAAALARLERELDVAPAANVFEGTSTWRVYNLLAHGHLWWQVALWPDVLAVVDAVLDDGCLVSSLSSIAIGPGETAQPLHADDQLIPLPRPHVPIVCNTMWALTDFTEANGATRIVPGSHTNPRWPDFGGAYDTVAAEMPRGSVLVWNGSLWHGGGANTTDNRRVGVAMNYCAGWIRQQENQQLGLDPALVAQMPERLQRLVGYGIYRGLIGHIDKHRPEPATVAGRSSGPDPVPTPDT